LEKKKRIVEGHYLQPHRRTQKPSWSIFFCFLSFAWMVLYFCSIVLTAYFRGSQTGGRDPFKGHQIFFNGRQTQPELSIYHRFKYSL
jgi:hypothetical protein